MISARVRCLSSTIPVPSTLDILANSRFNITSELLYGCLVFHSSLSSWKYLLILDRSSSQHVRLNAIIVLYKSSTPPQPGPLPKLLQLPFSITIRRPSNWCNNFLDNRFCCVHWSTDNLNNIVFLLSIILSLIHHSFRCLCAHCMR